MRSWQAAVRTLRTPFGAVHLDRYRDRAAPHFRRGGRRTQPPGAHRIAGEPRLAPTDGLGGLWARRPPSPILGLTTPDIWTGRGAPPSSALVIITISLAFFGRSSLPVRR
jgi:hypothetical protein